MTDNVDFTAVDMGGPKNEPPSPNAAEMLSQQQLAEAQTKLANEDLERQRLSRFFAKTFFFATITGIVVCLTFSLYISCHFLGLFERDYHDRVFTQSASLANADEKQTKSKISAGLNPEKSKKSDEEIANLSLRTLAPLIPASFSTALALILFITLARFVTGYSNNRKEESEKTQDYGAISTLVQEIGKLIQTLRGK